MTTPRIANNLEIVGAVAQGFTHASPLTQWDKDASNGGTSYADQSDSFTFYLTDDPDEPGESHYFVCPVRSTFEGSAREIQVPSCYLEALCRLDISAVAVN